MVTGATAIEVIFPDGTRSAAIISGTMPDKDIAMLQPVNPPLPVLPATMGSPGALQPATRRWWWAIPSACATR